MLPQLMSIILVECVGKLIFGKLKFWLKFWSFFPHGDATEKSVGHQSYHVLRIQCVTKNPRQCVQYLLRHFTLRHKCHSHGDAEERVRGSPQSGEFTVWGPSGFVLAIVTIHQGLVETFQFGQCSELLQTNRAEFIYLIYRYIKWSESSLRESWIKLKWSKLSHHSCYRLSQQQPEDF